MIFHAVAPTVVDYLYQKYYEVQNPVVGSGIADVDRQLADDADLFVATNGDDRNDGSFSHPLATIERARDLVRQIDKTGREGITVAIKAGEYRVTSIEFTEEDSGTRECPVTYCAYSDGEVILNGGVTLPKDSFKSITDKETLSRLSEDAQENVKAIDLFDLGITKEQYGKIYTIGSYNTADKYDGDWIGDQYCELFIDDQRQTIARYPNGTDYLYTGEVVFEGEGKESMEMVTKPNWETSPNPASDIYKIDRELSDRIAKWKTTDGVWMFGYWSYDWADGSTPIEFVDHENLTMSPKFVALYGAKQGAPYYFFNVLEELDAPGEWYLDRDNGILYFYPPEDFKDNSSVDLSLSTANVIKANASYLVFDGITVKGTRGSGVNITGNNNVFKNSLIKNVAVNALYMTGYNNLVVDNEITRTGQGGIIIDSGDSATLTPGNSKVENNLIHDWSEIYETYRPAIYLYGVGNSCLHNEMYNSPHEAISYAGNNHIIEYNLIHDVNLKTDDGGAIYLGRRWCWYGNIIRYNLIYDLGANGHEPKGIYMDDGLAGQTIYGNIIVNVPSFGIFVCGGRDMIIHDNIIINVDYPINYGSTCLAGLPENEDSHFHPHFKEGGDVWQNLYESPWQTDIWQEAFPQYKRYSDDFSNTDTPDFVLNPAYSEVYHNLTLSKRGTIGYICPEAYEYSTIEDNASYKLSYLKSIFVDPDNGNYNIRNCTPVGFEIDVPAMNEFGRQ